MRKSVAAFFATLLVCVTGCGYHTLGAAAHLAPGVKTLAVPQFVTRTDDYRTDTLMTQAVIREFAARTRMRITPDTNTDADAVLKGTILQQTITPLTYNTNTQQSSSYLVTVVAAVTLSDRDGKVLFRNNRYVFRQQYQSTTNLPTFLDESPAALERLSRDFARALVADVLESF